MPTNPLEGPKLKIERTKRHIDELESAIEVYGATKPCIGTTGIDPKTGWDRICIEPPKIIPANLSVIAGDALHNLRSGLDQLACRLAEQSGATITKDVYFPFGRDRDRFEASAKEKIRKLSPAAQRFICDLKPYKGGNDLLWSIHSLNLMDKHNLLVPMGGVSNINMRFVSAKEQIENGVSPSKAQDHHQVDYTLIVAFRDIESLKLQSVLTTLNQFCDLVTEIISLAERRFF